MDDLIEMIGRFQKTGDPALAEKIIIALYAEIYLFILPKVPSADVEDVRQDAVISIVHALYSFRGNSRGEFYGFCYRIVRVTIAKYYRKRSREPLTHADFEEILALIDKDAVNARSSEIDRSDAREAVAMLEKADPECFELLYSRHVLGVRLRELGEERGISENAARMRVNRCEQSFLKG
jgi:RNA polymerase sigma factor (sigma-70 family)